MSKMRSSAELAELSDALAAFIDAFHAVTELSSPSRGGPAVIANWEHVHEGREDEWEQARRVASGLTGPASYAFDVAGISVHVQGIQGALNPVRMWHVIYDPNQVIGRNDVLAAAYDAQGVLKLRASKRRREERSLAGRLAVFVGFSTRVRELSELPAQSGRGYIVQGLVALFQLFAVAWSAAVAVAVPILVVRWLS